MATLSSQAGILAKALHDMLKAWEQTAIGWHDQARSDFEKEYIAELTLTIKGALGAMTEINEFLNQARRECS